MNKYLGHGITENIDGFDFLGGDVFSLCQLEYVLLSVCDLQGAVLQQTRTETHLGTEVATDAVTRLTHLPSSPIIKRSVEPFSPSVVLTGSHFPMSPVCSHPSWSRASAVFSGSFRYPWNTFGPLTHTWTERCWGLLKHAFLETYTSYWSFLHACGMNIVITASSSVGQPLRW